MADDWITTQEASQMSGYHPESIRALIREGRIKGRKFLIVWQVSRSSLLAYIQKQARRGEKRGRKPLTN